MRRREWSPGSSPAPPAIAGSASPAMRRVFQVAESSGRRSMANRYSGRSSKRTPWDGAGRKDGREDVERRPARPRSGPAGAPLHGHAEPFAALLDHEGRPAGHVDPEDDVRDSAGELADLDLGRARARDPSRADIVRCYPASSSCMGRLGSRIGARRRSIRASVSSRSLSLRTSTSTSNGLSMEVEDGDREGAVVAVALELGDDPAVLDLTLADADLELAGSLAGVAELDVLDVRDRGRRSLPCTAALDVVARVERHAEAGHGLAELEGRGSGRPVRVWLRVSTASTRPSRMAMPARLPSRLISSSKRRAQGAAGIVSTATVSVFASRHMRLEAACGARGRPGSIGAEIERQSPTG